MQIIEKQVVTGETIVMDDKTFLDCHYSGCKLLYGGGDCTWVTSTFKDCQIILSGAAQKTANFLAGFGIVPASGTQLPPTGNFGFPNSGIQ